MNWPEEIMEEAERIYMRERPRGYPIRGVLNELMTFAVEAVAARGGLPYEEIQSLGRRELVDRVIGQGAAIATLQAKYDLIVGELQAAGPLAREVLALRAKVAELEKTQRGSFCLEQAKLREAAEEGRGVLQSQIHEALKIAKNATPDSNIVAVMRQKMATIEELSESVSSWQGAEEKQRKRAEKAERQIVADD